MKTKKHILYFGLSVWIFAFFITNALAQISKQNGYNAKTEIAGKVYFDVNNNGIFDANDFGLPNQTVVVANGKYVAVSNQNGDYHIAVDPGYYEITAKLSITQHLTTGAQSAQVENGDIDIENDFGIAIDAANADLQVNMFDVNQPQPGLLSTIELVYTNKGGTEPDGSIVLIKDKNYVFNSAQPSPTTIIGDTLLWRFSGLKPFKEERIKIKFKLLETTALGTPLKSFVSISGNENDLEKTNNQDVLMQTTTGSFLPNSKIVDLSGIVKTYSTQPTNVSLVYTIYFQNTTNLPVNDMVIIDTLSNKLAAGTFTLLGSSHPCTIQISNNALIFEFLNINLPDSITDFTGSKGWIQFIVNTSNDVFLDDSVKNVADIYFDYNVPTRTSEARVDFVNVSAIDEYGRSEFVHVYPNPFEEHFLVRFDKPCFQCNFELSDVAGKTVFSQVIGTPTSYSFVRNNIASGFYVYKITQQNQVVEVGKLIAR